MGLKIFEEKSQNFPQIDKTKKCIDKKFLTTLNGIKTKMPTPRHVTVKLFKEEEHISRAATEKQHFT